MNGFSVLTVSDRAYMSVAGIWGKGDILFGIV